MVNTLIRTATGNARMEVRIINVQNNSEMIVNSIVFEVSKYLRNRVFRDEKSMNLKNYVYRIKCQLQYWVLSIIDSLRINRI